LAKKTLIASKEGKKLKGFELSPQVVSKKLCTIFFFSSKRKTKNPPRYMPSKPYQKNPNH
jgi:hypothetical protein